jgi:hypothetical protein
VKWDEGNRRYTYLVSQAGESATPGTASKRFGHRAEKASANILVFGRFTWPSYTSPMRWQENHQRRKERSDDIQVLFRSRDKFAESLFEFLWRGPRILHRSHAFKQLCEQSAARHLIRKLFSQRAKNRSLRNRLGLELIGGVCIRANYPFVHDCVSSPL